MRKKPSHKRQKPVTINWLAIQEPNQLPRVTEQLAPKILASVAIEIPMLQLSYPLTANLQLTEQRLPIDEQVVSYLSRKIVAHAGDNDMRFMHVTVTLLASESKF